MDECRSRPSGNQPGAIVVCRPMTTPRRLLPLLAVATLLGACASSAGPSPSVGASASPPAPSRTEPPPSAIDLPTTDPGGGGSSGNTGSGIIDPAPPIGSVDPNDPAGSGGAQLVRPKAGQKDPHPVAPTKLEASVDGRHVLIKVSWYSGVEPCNVLDSVKVDRDGSTVAITPMEGTGDPDAMCIEIAVLKATAVDLGELAAGTWTISAEGDASEIELEVG